MGGSIRVAAFCPRHWLLVGVAVMLVASAGCGSTSTEDMDAAPPADPGVTAVPTMIPTVLAKTPHDTTAFTEGLVFDGPRLYESTGKLGKSQLRELDPTTGAVLRSADLVAIEWDKAGFAPLRQVPMHGRGWGLCYDGKRLVRSDGTDRLHFHDPTSFAENGSVTVTFEGQPLSQLNELECVDGQVLANVFMTDRIVRNDPATGDVTAMVNARRLVDDSRRARGEVLNGIAYAGSDEYVLAGKYWPTMFRVRLDV
jgi:glutamine cyclotransferase